METPLTCGPGGRVLTNARVWSPDGEWIVYDTRSDAAGSHFDGNRIEMVHAVSKEVRILYEARHGACCGVASWHPTEPKVVFILGPEHPTEAWNYGPSRRQGVIVDARRAGVAVNLDARDLVPPFTPGALRGGSHVHMFDAAGEWLSFTYEDEVLSRHAQESDAQQRSLRGVAVAVPGRVIVPREHPRNHDGAYFSTFVTKLTANPVPGSDDMMRAVEEAWIAGRRSLAVQGQVVTARGEAIWEVFVVDLPDDLRAIGDGPLEGTLTHRPAPPAGTRQRRLTFTADRKYPGLQGPRHWLRSSPDGSRIAFLMKDDDGIVQLWTISPAGGPAVPLTRSNPGIESAFTWHPDGSGLAAVVAGRVAVIDARHGAIRYRTDADEAPPRPEACVFSPDGRSIAFVRHRAAGNQIYIATV